MKVDIIVVGAGPGGMEAVAQGLRAGKQVVVVERDKMGGTCLNRGCIPTKALCKTAQLLSEISEASTFGINVAEFKADFAAAINRKDEIVAAIRANVEMMMSKANVVVGEASLIPGGVKVGNDIYTADMTIIATGSAPVSLSIPGAERAMDSTELLNLKTLPGNIAIIGGGVIGMEFASILSAYGVKVTVLEYAPEILPAFDREVAKRLRSLMSRRGVKIITGVAVTSIAPYNTVTYQSKGKELSIEADAVLMAVGRKPVIPSGADEIGIEYTRRGIVVDDNFMTSVPGVYAIGDVNGHMMLAHVAEAQAANLFGKNDNLDVVPADVFTMPECSMVGLTEEACGKIDGLNYKVSKSLFRANGKAMAMGEPDGFVKLIIDADSRKVLGCHIIGAHAADIIQEVATVMASGLTVDAIADTVHAHPTLTEVVAAAARQA